jgi:FAD/FMN-containing dehydrogenase/Fe-S oxidoreductase
MTHGRAEVDGLAATLRRDLRGQVATDRGVRALYATDASNYRVVPDLVVVPADVDDLAAAVTHTAQAQLPIVLRGGGTSMAGNAIGGVVIDVSRHLNRILELDPRAHTAVVEPGVVLSDLVAGAGEHGLTFGADPSSASRAPLGGMIASNACGAHSVAWGTTADSVRGLEVALADGSRLDLDVPAPGDDVAQRTYALARRPGREGELHRRLLDLTRDHERLIRRRFGAFSRQISGYALDRLLPERGYDPARLLCGSEGTLAVTLRATVALVRPPRAKILVAFGFPDAGTAADSVPYVLPLSPLTMESINATLVDRLPRQVRAGAVAAGLPPGTVWLLVEVGGETEQEALAAGKAVAAVVRDAGLGNTSSLVADRAAQAVLWRCRRDGAGLATRRPDGAEAWGGWEDAAVPPQQLGSYLRRLDELLDRHQLSGASYGHFGEGCMHMRMDFDLLSETGVARYRSFVEEAADLVVSLGGSISGEHGDGRARSELLRRMYGDEAMAVFAEVKRVFDPAGVMNPQVIVDPAPLDAHLRHTGRAKSRDVETVFAYGADDGSFAQAQRRCVGIGKCRQSAGGVMCPSFQVTREERHSTRGRAHLLWEMLEGGVITDGWRSPEVRDALDLCLSCKGCLSDCPVNVDMATYKSEFTYHHYRGRPWARPKSHWSMGWLPLWARLATVAPATVNRITGSRLQGTMKRLGGIAAQRPIPTFAEQTLTASMKTRVPAGRSSRGRLLLWPDTFTNFLAPQVGRSAIRVLEAAGFEVVLPTGPVCCGLTWISTGQLNVARRVLERSLRVLAPHLVAGLPVVGLEPSCTAVFRHDTSELLPGNALADQARTSTFTLAEALARFAADWEPPKVDRQALAQVHCHQHAVMGFGPDRALLMNAGVDLTVPDSGCCGLAGNFGFEQGHYEVSRAVGERVILPTVRELDPATLVLADGFSCRTQIEHGTGRPALHLAQLLAGGLNGNDVRRS